MSIYPRKIDRAAAERLLRGEPADPRHPEDFLAVLLAAAAAPAHAGELAGEEAAVARFRQARTTAAWRAADGGAEAIGEAGGLPGRPWRARPESRWVRHPMRIALVALTVTTAGGAALAAGATPWSQEPGDRRPATSAGSPSRSDEASPGRGQGGSAATTPRSSLVGLCRAYTAGAGDAPGKALDKPAFAALIAAAGGKHKVPSYCAELLAGESKGRGGSTQSSPAEGTPSQPGQSGKSGRGSPSDQPSPSDEATGRPSVRPTPTAQPGKTIPHTRSPETRP
ncbi:MAG TPA: hypothetical protein VFU43_15155 [Streptosporangiaceae bacterium]|nr:hypothetical protein [Streptosporangiaceae bacterium]